jgi:hypothetical protein
MAMIGTVSAELLFICDFHTFFLRVLFFQNLIYRVRMKLSPNPSATEATIIGNIIRASPMTIILSASFLTFP